MTTETNKEPTLNEIYHAVRRERPDHKFETAIVVAQEIRDHICSAHDEDDDISHNGWTNWFNKIWNKIKSIPGDIANIPGAVSNALAKIASDALGDLVKIGGLFKRLAAPVVDLVGNTIKLIEKGQSVQASQNLTVKAQFKADSDVLAEFSKAFNACIEKKMPKDFKMRVVDPTEKHDLLSGFISDVEHAVSGLLRDACPNFTEELQSLTDQLNKIAESDQADENNDAFRTVLTAVIMLAQMGIAIFELIASGAPRDATVGAEVAGEGGTATLCGTVSYTCLNVFICVFKSAEAIATFIVLQIDASANSPLTEEELLLIRRMRQSSV